MKLHVFTPRMNKLVSKQLCNETTGHHCSKRTGTRLGSKLYPSSMPRMRNKDLQSLLSWPKSSKKKKDSAVRVTSLLTAGEIFRKQQ